MARNTRDQVIDLMRQQRYPQALSLLRQLISNNPHDWGLLYMAGQCCRFMGDYTTAISYLQKATTINGQEASALLALGIAFQLNEQLQLAAETFVRAINANPHYELAYNSLALTQEKLCEFDKALHNYDAGAKALARRIVLNMKNVESNKIYKHIHSENVLYIQYACDAAIYLCSITGGIDALAWATGEQAIAEERNEHHRGLYWIEYQSNEGKNVRLFLPNYFTTFREFLRHDVAYSTLIGNRGMLLKELGRHVEAAIHLEEADEFTPSS